MRGGRKLSEETRRRMSESKKGQPSALKGRPSPLRGRRLSEEHKQAMAESHRGEEFTDERKQAISTALKGKPKSVEHRQKIKDRWAEFSPEQRRAMNAKQIEAMRSANILYLAGLTPEEMSSRMSNAQEAAQCANPSSLEKILWQVLEVLGIAYEKQVRIGPYYADILIRSRDLVIECDGEYWHSLPEHVGRDRRRDAYMIGLGFTVIRLPEKEIRKDPEQALSQRVDWLRVA